MFTLSEEQTKFLRQNNIKNCYMSEDGLIVSESVQIDVAVERLPVKFHIINGSFTCNAKIISGSFHNFPLIVKGSVSCFGNNFKKFIGRPNVIHQDFNVSMNDIESLEGFPQFIDGCINLSSNKIKNLEGICVSVTDLILDHNNLDSFKGGPEFIRGDLRLWGASLKTFEHMPKYIGGHLMMSSDYIKSLKDIHKYVKEVNGILQVHSEITHSILGLLLIKTSGISFKGSVSRIEHLLNENLNTDRRGLLRVQHQLIEMGFPEMAAL